MRDPAYQWAPPRKESYGDLAAGLAEQVGMPMDDEQILALDAIFAEDEPGIPTNFEIGIVAPRQNLKTATLEIAAMTDLFILGEQLHVWTAHLFDTAQRAFTDMVAMIGRTPDLKARCKWPPSASHGDESIELLTGEKIEFHARSTGGGRGLTGDKITLDEALFLQPSTMGALLPVLATRPGAQVRYGSSAGLVRSEVLRTIRDRGRRGGERRLAYFEWAAPHKDCGTPDCEHKPGTATDCALDDTELWFAANPALGRRIPMDTMRAFRGAMPPEEFSREFLSWWEDPVEAALAELAINPETWRDRRDPTSTPLDPVVLAIDVSPGRQTTLAAAGWDKNGRKHVEVIQTGQGTGWVIDVLTRVIADHDPAALVLDEIVVGTLGAQLRAAGIEPITSKGAQMAQASMGFADDVQEDRVRHRNDQPLADAVRSAVWRKLGDGSAFNRRGGTDISPLVAVALASWGLQNVAKPRPAQIAAPRAIPAEEPRGAREADLNTVGF